MNLRQRMAAHRALAPVFFMEMETGAEASVFFVSYGIGE